MNRALLEKPFERDEIKQREGNFGKILDYIEGTSIIQRLNDAFDGAWSFKILEHKIITEADEVLVLAELRAGELVKTQFGSSKITRAKNSGEIISLADDLKASATDALKKSATLFGVGLYLYKNGNGAKPDTNKEHHQKVPSPAETKNTSGKLPDNGNGSPPGNGSDPKPELKRGTVEIGFQPIDKSENIYKPTFKVVENNEPEKSFERGNGKGKRQMTLKQFEYIRSYSKRSIEELNKLSEEMFNRELAYLSVSEASTFIDHMHAGF